MEPRFSEALDFRANPITLELEIQMQTTPSVGVDTAPSPTELSGQPVHPATGVDALCETASATSGRTISPSLYNVDLAPTKREGRRWTSYSIFTLGQ
jgi:nucleobase:cation symporter-1, NCS1 family